MWDLFVCDSLSLSLDLEHTHTNTHQALNVGIASKPHEKTNIYIIKEQTRSARQKMYAGERARMRSSSNRSNSGSTDRDHHTTTTTTTASKRYAHHYEDLC